MRAKRKKNYAGKWNFNDEMENQWKNFGNENKKKKKWKKFQTI